ncbi:hypothetical protein [Intrasporangium sp. YIM S08009]|uniref:hypothetical protein n=1 Tax=Intrasporangium zincisolvens TaxID=3080018 RepID=UPI002B05D953|nr:hypothetical protein [Intrasporangium sp. YIM S08009]
MPTSSSGGFFRSLVATLLGLLAVVLLPVGLVAFWASTTLTDTDAFAQELGPVVTQPKVQDALADSVTTGVLGAIDLRPAAETALEPIIRTEATKIVASQAVERAWTASVRSAHEQFVSAMQGRGNTTVGSDGRVSLVLQVPLPGVTEALQQAGVPNIAAALKPTVRVPLVDASQMSTVQRVYRATSAWGMWGPVAVAVLGLLAVLVAVRHARALGWLAVGWGVVSVLGIVALMMARGPVVDRVGSPVARTVADAAYGVAARGLYVELAVALGVSVVLLVVAGVAGHIGRARSAY